MVVAQLRGVEFNQNEGEWRPEYDHYRAHIVLAEVAEAFGCPSVTAYLLGLGKHGAKLLDRLEP